VGAVPQALDGVAQCVDDVTFAIFEPRCCSPECGLVRSVERQFVNQVSAVRMHWDAVISAEMIRRRQDLCVRVLETPVGTQRLNLSSLDRWPSGPAIAAPHERKQPGSPTPPSGSRNESARRGGAGRAQLSDDA
jgi:hypothetical protein